MRYALLFVAAMSANSHAIEKIAADSHSGFRLDAKELAVAKNLFDDEKKIFLQGGNVAFIGGQTISATAKEVATTYDENQVAGDQKYFKKTVHLNGIISSINSGINNKPSISLVGKNLLQSPQVQFAAPDISRIAKLKKGQKISFVCNGAGVLIGAPVFNSCLFADQYADLRIEKITGSIDDYLKSGATESEEAKLLTVLIVMLAKKLPDQSGCFTGKGTCAKEIGKITSKNMDKDLQETVEILLSHGIVVKKNND